MLTTGLRMNPMWTKTEADGNQKAAIVLQGGKYSGWEAGQILDVL